MRRLAPFLRSTIRNERGAMAVEFALVFPFLAFLLLGGSELAIALSADRKVQLAATTVGDVMSQLSNPDAQGVEKLMRIPKAVVGPYGPEEVETVLTAVWIDSEGKGVVDCSIAAGPGAVADVKGRPYVLPDRLRVMRERSVIVTKTSMRHHLVSGMIWRDGFDIVGESTFNPRNNARFRWTGC